MQLTNCHAKTYIEKFTYSLITVRKNDWKEKKYIRWSKGELIQCKTKICLVNFSQQFVLFFCFFNCFPKESLIFQIFCYDSVPEAKPVVKHLETKNNC